jgi:hypothetical protein
MAALRRMKMAKWLLPRLVRKEQKLRKKFADISTEKKDITFQVDRDIKVY